MKSIMVLSALSHRTVLIPCTSPVFTISTLPQSAVSCRTVPLEVQMLMSFPTLRTFITMLRWPFLENKKSSTLTLLLFIPHLLAKCRVDWVYSIPPYAVYFPTILGWVSNNKFTVSWMRMLQLRTNMRLLAAVSPGVHTEPRGPGLSPPWCSWCWALSRRPEAAWRTQGGRTGQCSAASSPCHHWWDSHSDLGHSALSREEPWKKSFRLSWGHHQPVHYSPHEVVTEQKLQIRPWACRCRKLAKCRALWDPLLCHSSAVISNVHCQLQNQQLCRWFHWNQKV